MTVPIIIYTKKNFYILDKLNEKIEALKAAGLIDFWFYEDFDTRKLTVQEDDGLRVLTIAQLLGSFQILLAGCLVGLAAFCFEILSHRMRSWKLSILS